MPDVSVLEDLAKTAFARHQAGELNEAEALYRKVLDIDNEHLNALQLLGLVALSTDRTDEAIALFERAVTVVNRQDSPPPQYSALYNNFGNALRSAGRHDEALVSYRRSLELWPGNSEVYVNLGSALLTQGNVAGAIENYEAAVRSGGRADWHHQLGKVYAAVRRFDDAEASYRAALRENATLPSALYDLGVLLNLHRNKPVEAIELFARLRDVDPDHTEVDWTLGNIFRDIGKFVEAIQSLRRYLDKVPKSAIAHLYLGMTLSETGRYDEAIDHIEQGIALDPSNGAVGYLELGNVLLRAHRRDEAQEKFLQAYALQPIFTCKAAVAGADFSALFLVAPGFSNTPYTYLVSRCNYDAHFLAVLSGGDYDIAALQARADVVVNLISDADEGQAILPGAGALVDRLAQSTVNHPNGILLTGRAMIARALSNVSGCRVAKISRHSGAALLADDLPADAQALPFPFLARVVGLHGGEAFQKVENLADLHEFVSKGSDVDYYLMEYLDYQSPDGYYRKYRFFWVDGALLPYHMAISDHWKVHHFRTDMANQAWMKEEEEAFLAQPESIFNPEQMAVLHVIGRTIGLEFMGMDCGLDREGNVVLFEANATMLVNGNNHEFPYKVPYVHRIKVAFDTMLARLARAARG